jgi:hypothetical protein
MSRHPRWAIPDYPRNRPQTPMVMALIRDYYAKEGNEAGGLLHVVLDDGNLERSHIEYCAERAFAEGDEDGFRIACMLLSMTPTQRRRCYLRSALSSTSPLTPSPLNLPQRLKVDDRRSFTLERMGMSLVLTEHRFGEWREMSRSVYCSVVAMAHYRLRVKDGQVQALASQDGQTWITLISMRLEAE